jgi:multisubunit Na+/H+ antiporter MnhC subunit
MLELVHIYYAGALGLIVLGMAGVVMSSHLVRIIFSISLLESGVNLILLLSSYREGAAAPIMLDGKFPTFMADPVPQALVLTSIVIGVGVLALALTLAMRLQRAYGTLDIGEIRQCMERDISVAADIDMPISDHAPREAK